MSILFFIILVLLILKPHIASTQVIEASTLWIKTLVPAMYPSLVCIDIISNSNVIQKFTKILFPIFKKIFNINHQKSAFIILLAFICGTPASTKLIYESKKNNQISENEANNLICSFSFLSLPFTMLVLKKTKLIIIYYICNILVSIIWMNIFNKKENSQLEYKINNIDFINNFTSSIKKNIELLLNILGIVIFFRILINLFLNNNFIGYSYIEILGGIISTSNIIIILSSLGFLGLSIHIQMLSIYPNLKYKNFFLSRLIYLTLGVLIFLLNT